MFALTGRKHARVRTNWRKSIDVVSILLHNKCQTIIEFPSALCYISPCFRFCITFPGQTADQYTRLHPFNSPLSRTTRVSQYQKSKTSPDLLEQETVRGSGISWAILVCKSAPCPRQITTPALHHPAFQRPDVLPAAQPTVSKH